MEISGGGLCVKLGYLEDIGNRSDVGKFGHHWLHFPTAAFSIVRSPNRRMLEFTERTK
jgi:hypothetical protein